MAQTTSATMVIPDVWADMVTATYLGRLVFGALAQTDDRLTGNPGDTITFPKWLPLSDISADAVETVALVPEAMTTDDTSTATIKEIGKAVEITDKAVLVGFGDPFAEARSSIAKVVARKIDTDLRTAAELSLPAAQKTAGTSGAVISWAAITKGIVIVGDEWDPSEWTLLINPKQSGDLLNDPNFISRDKMGEGAVIPRGVLGQIGGMNVQMTSRLTVNGGPTYNALMVQRGSLGLFYKRRALVETDRDILARSTVVTTNVHYGTKRVDDRGVVLIETT